MSVQPTFTVRIRTEQEQDMDWMVQPDQICFQQALEVIARVLPHTTVTAFEYEDEDGDRITVKSDEEMKSMFQTYFNLLSEEDYARGLLPPLIIFPRVGKTPQNRNKFGLKIKTDKQSISKSSKPVLMVSDIQKKEANMQTPVPMEYGQTEQLASKRADQQVLKATDLGHNIIRTSSDLRQMLSTQDITEEDLQILNLVGKGNIGHVYRALHRPTQTIMAVKMMQLDVSTEEQNSILSELDILNKCNSPVIIGFYKAFFTENRISICTEFMDGGSLDKYGLIPEPILGRMAVFMVEGLCYMWALKILHRDIKPSNVLVNTQGQVKLCDFGVSTQLVKSIARTFVGTNAYMAPERMRGEEYSNPAEVWSLGITLFELATGRFPYGDTHSFSLPMPLLNTITNEPVPKLPVNEFSLDFIDFVFKCMQPEPSHRLRMEELSKHIFINMNNDGNLALIAGWIQTKLSERHGPS